MNLDSSKLLATGVLVAAIMITLAPPPRPDEGPRITRVVPDVQLAATGRMMTVEGEGFDRSSLVYLGGTVVRGSRLDRDGRIVAPIPAGFDTGTYELRVVTPGGAQVSRASAFTLTQSETAPVVRAVSPAILPSAIDVPIPLTIEGSGFLPGLSVRVGTRRAIRVIDVSHDRVDVLVEALPDDGIHDLVVTNPNDEEGRLHHAVTIGQV